MLAQTGTDPTDDRFPIAVLRKFSGRNVDVSTRFMAIDGKVVNARPEGTFDGKYR